MADAELKPTHLGIRSGQKIRTALDTLLSEFVEYDREKQQWYHEKQQLLSQIASLQKQIEQHNNIHEHLAKRNKMLEMSLQHLHQNGKHAPPLNDQKHQNIKISIKKKNDKSKHVWSATLPTSLDPEKMLQVIARMSDADEKESNNGKKIALYPKFLESISEDDQNNISHEMNGKLPKSSNGNINSNANASANTNNNNNNNNDNNNDNNEDDIKASSSFDEEKVDDLLPSNNNNNNNNNKSNENDKNYISSLENVSYSAASFEPKEKRKFKPPNSVLQKQINDKKFQINPVANFRSHFDAIRTLKFHSQRPILLSGSDDGLIKLWSCSTLKDSINPVVTLRGHEGSVMSSCILESADSFVTGGMDGHIFVWQYPSEAQIIKYMKYNDMPSTRSLKEFREWEIFDAHKNAIVWDLCVSPNVESNAFFISISDDRIVKLYDYENKKAQELYRTNNEKNIPSCCLWVNDNKNNNKIMIGLNNGNIEICDATTGKYINTMKPIFENNDEQKISSSSSSSLSPIYKLTYDNNNPNLIYAGYEDSYLRVFDTTSNKCVKIRRVHTDAVTSLTINKEDNVILTSSHDCRIRVWDLLELNCLQDIEPRDTHHMKLDEGINSLTFVNKESKLIASGGADGNIRIYKGGIAQRKL